MPLHQAGELRRFSSEVSKELGREFKLSGLLGTGRTGFVDPGRFRRTATVAPRTRQLFHRDDDGFDFFQTGCGLLPEGRIRDACLGLTSGNGAGNGAGFAPDACPSGTFQVGTKCVDLSAIPPGGDPFTFAAGGEVVQGGFGLPAQTPLIEERIRRKCMRGMVLGVDDLCYPKAVLGARSSFRKWKRPVRPPITRRDTVAIRRAASAKQRVFDLAKDVGLHVAKTAHRRKR